MITFNNGAQWQRLNVPGACVSCNIHVHVDLWVYFDAVHVHYVMWPTLPRPLPAWLFAAPVSPLQSAGCSNVQLINSQCAAQCWVCPRDYHRSWLVTLSHWFNNDMQNTLFCMSLLDMCALPPSHISSFTSPGNVGKTRSNNQPQKLFVSKDGGYSWKVCLSINPEY